MKKFSKNVLASKPQTPHIIILQSTIMHGEINRGESIVIGIGANSIEIYWRPKSYFDNIA